MEKTYKDYLGKFKVLELMCSECNFILGLDDELEPADIYVDHLESDIKDKFKVLINFNNSLVYLEPEITALQEQMILLDELLAHVLKNILDLLNDRMTNHLAKKYPDINMEQQFEKEKRHITARMERSLKVLNNNAPEIIVNCEFRMLKEAIKNPFNGKFMKY